MDSEPNWFPAAGENVSEADTGNLLKCRWLRVVPRIDGRNISLIFVLIGCPADRRTFAVVPKLIAIKYTRK